MSNLETSKNTSVGFSLKAATPWDPDMIIHLTSTANNATSVRQHVTYFCSKLRIHSCPFCAWYIYSRKIYCHVMFISCIIFNITVKYANDFKHILEKCFDTAEPSAWHHRWTGDPRALNKRLSKWRHDKSLLKVPADHINPNVYAAAIL